MKAGAHEPFGYPTWHDGAGIVDLVVDGRVAYTTEDIPRFQYGTEQSMTPAGFEGLQATPALDPATGAMTISESQRIFRCEGDDNGRPTEEECRSVLDTGIRLERTISLTREHSIADVRDRWVSSDGLAHQVRARYTADMPPAREKAEGPQWRFPGDPAFKLYAAGDVMPQGPGTVLVRDAADLRAPGALSFAPAPERFTFDDGGALAETAQLAVPAGGAAPVRRVFALGRDVGEAAALGRATEDGFEAPRVEISSVSGAATATVRGRATDNVGVVALSVNGRAAAVAADGSFSVPVALLRGANEISVTATDGAGLSANARVVAQARGRPRLPRAEGQGRGEGEGGARRDQEGGLQGAHAARQLAHDPQGPRGRPVAQGGDAGPARHRGPHPRERRQAPLRVKAWGYRELSHAGGGRSVARMLIERATEISTLERSLASVSEGTGAAVVIEAPAGAGKSALLDVVETRAREAGLAGAPRRPRPGRPPDPARHRPRAAGACRRGPVDPFGTCRARPSPAGRRRPVGRPRVARVRSPVWRAADAARC